jgi:hypothetical protein
VTEELEVIWRETVVAYFKLNPNICLEELKNQFHVVVHF